MKKFYLLAIILSGLFITNNLAQEQGFGLGVILGEPTGISAKMWTGPETALDFGLGYSFTTSNSILHLYTDYVFHNSEWIRSDKNIIVYYGPGVRLHLNEHQSRLGVRGVIGILWIPEGSQFDLFVEAAPMLDIIPATKFGLAGGIGGRFFFE